MPRSRCPLVHKTQQAWWNVASGRQANTTARVYAAAAAAAAAADADADADTTATTADRHMKLLLQKWSLCSWGPAVSRAPAATARML